MHVGVLVLHRLGVFTLLLALAACTQSAETDDFESDDARLTMLEDAIGFDGAALKLDESALARIDDRAMALEAIGAEPDVIERETTRSVLNEALAIRSNEAMKASAVSSRADRPGLITPLDIYDADLFSFNDQERTLCRSARIVCVRVLLAGARARLSAQSEYADGNIGGRIDAFRHTYWNALMTVSVGDAYAKAWADAHENGTPGNRATEKERILSDMDFHNNAEGRRLGGDPQSGDLKAAVRAALTSGALRAVRYDRGRTGRLVPSSECSDTVRCG